jgi:hypothetical protein
MRTYTATYTAAVHEVRDGKVVPTSAAETVAMVELSPGVAVNKTTAQRLGLMARESDDPTPPKPTCKQAATKKREEAPRGVRARTTVEVRIAPKGKLVVRPAGSTGTAYLVPECGWRSERVGWRWVHFDKGGKALLGPAKHEEVLS